jgi:predicted nucleic acid-binding protein
VKGRVFFDTNILIYADDADAGAKREQAQQIIEAALNNGNGVLSTQVLQEYFVVATRKLGLPAEIAQKKVEILATMTVIAVEVGHVVEAIKLHRLYGFSFWDCLILYCAKVAGCPRLLSEDLQHGRAIEGVTVENPFLEPHSGRV